MAVIGVGVDVVDVERVGAALRRTPGLAARLFTDAELTLPLASLAARFAAKEALAKALGVPAGMHWHDAEVHTDADGRPAFALRGTVAAAAAAVGVASWHLSLSHDAGIAAAMVVGEA